MVKNLALGGGHRKQLQLEGQLVPDPADLAKPCPQQGDLFCPTGPRGLVASMGEERSLVLENGERRWAREGAIGLAQDGRLSGDPFRHTVIP